MSEEMELRILSSLQIQIHSTKGHILEKVYYKGAVHILRNTNLGTFFQIPDKTRNCKPTLKNTIRDGGSTALHTTFTVYTAKQYHPSVPIAYC